MCSLHERMYMCALCTHARRMAMPRGQQLTRSLTGRATTVKSNAEISRTERLNWIALEKEYKPGTGTVVACIII